MADIYTLSTATWQRGAPPQPGVDPEYAHFERELQREKRRLVKQEGVDERSAGERAFLKISLDHGRGRVEAAIERQRAMNERKSQ